MSEGAPHFDPVSAIEQEQRERLSRVAEGLRMNTAATTRVEGKVDAIDAKVDAVTARLDHAGLNSHAPAILALAEASPQIVALLSRSNDLMQFVERRSTRRVMWTEFRSMIHYKLLTRVVWVLLPAALTAALTLYLVKHP